MCRPQARLQRIRGHRDAGQSPPGEWFSHVPTHPHPGPQPRPHPEAYVTLWPRVLPRLWWHAGSGFPLLYMRPIAVVCDAFWVQRTGPDQLHDMVPQIKNIALLLWVLAGFDQ